MNTKETGELRRRWRADKNWISKIYGCYVNTNKEIVSYIDESLDMMAVEESEKYLGLLKKTLSGTMGKNLIDIVFSTEQVMSSDEHAILMKLRETELRDRETREIFYKNVIDNLDMGDKSFLILMAFDAYDVPRKRRDGRNDESETQFRYFLCCICPIKETAAQLGYFPGDNEFHYTAGQIVAPPELGFLFPAFDDRASNIYNALYYTRCPEDLHQDFIDAIFKTEPPLSAVEQREAFQETLSSALEDECSVDVFKSIYDEITARINENKEMKIPERLELTAGDIASILRGCDVSEERIEKFKTQCAERLGEGVMAAENLVVPGKFEIKTSLASVSVGSEDSYLVETREIDGRRYILIPAEDYVEINGMSVKFQAPPKEHAESAEGVNVSENTENAETEAGSENAEDVENAESYAAL